MPRIYGERAKARAQADERIRDAAPELLRACKMLLAIELVDERHICSYCHNIHSSDSHCPVQLAIWAVKSAEGGAE